MKIIYTDLPSSSFSPISYNWNIQDFLFTDIETTGLSPARHQIYCIGAAYMTENTYRICQFFAETPEEEPLILKEFLNLFQSLPQAVLLTFNGSTFDLPFIRKRCEHFGLLCDTADIPHIDLYREARNLRCLLGLTGLKQKDIEQFLQIEREDIYSGKELIQMYRDYVKSPDKDLLHLLLLLLHNLDDMKGMYDLLPILNYRQLPAGDFTVSSLQTEQGADFSGDPKTWAVFQIAWEVPLPQHVFRHSSSIQILLHEKTGLIRLPVSHMTLRYYLKDYKNYYYLPEEDTIVHKSVGQFVDAAHRTPAKADNCFLKKTADFIQILKPAALPSFQESYKSAPLYLELDPQALFPEHKDTCRTILTDYICQLKHLLV